MAIVPKFSIDRRYLSAAFSAAIHAAALALLLLWHFAPVSRDDKPAITVVDLPDQPPDKKSPPPPQAQPTRGAAKAEKAAPPAPRAEAAPLVAAIVPLVIPSYTPAPVPATGTQPAAGAALAGTGAGAGGAGNGTGGGGNGGGGTADASRKGTDPEIIRGDFKQSDYPKELRAQGPKGTTFAEVVVGTNGRVTSCRVSRASGIPQFDAKTCQILLQRFHYRPARDVAGRPIAAPDSFSVDWDYVNLDHD